MNITAAMKRLFSHSFYRQRIGPDSDPDVSGFIMGTGSAHAKEVISKSRAFDYNLGYVYACSNKNAMVISASRLRLFVMTGSGEMAPKVMHKRLSDFERKRLLKAADSRVVGGVELDEIFFHPFLDLMRNPAPGQNYQSLMANTQTGQELQGDNLWVVQFDRALGIPKSIDSVPIHRTNVLLNKNGTVNSYEILANNKKIVVPARNALHFKMPPSFDYFGTSPLSAASLNAKLFNNTLILESALAENQGIPSTVVKFKGGTLQRDKIRQLESDWNSVLRGINKSGKVKVIDEEFDVDTLSLAPKDLQFLQGRKMLREDICNIFGVPVTLFTSEANLASAKTAVEFYNMYTIEPRIQTLSQTINSVINNWYPEANGRLFCVFENQLDLKDEPRRQANVMQAQAQEIITTEEARHLLNLGE